MKRSSLSVNTLRLLILLVFFSQSCQEKSENRELSGGQFRLISDSITTIQFNDQFVEQELPSIVTLKGGAGVVAADLDNDELVDLLFFSQRQEIPPKLYKNQGDFRFEEIPSFDQLIERVLNGYINEICISDLNNDGLIDLYIANPHPDGDNILLINSGGLKFEEKANAYGLDISGTCENCAFIDADGDDDPDLYLAFSPPLPSPVFNLSYYDTGAANTIYTDRFYLNTENNFSDETNSWGIPMRNDVSHHVAVSDFNGDMWLDLYITNDYLGSDRLLLNQSGEKFVSGEKQLMSYHSLSSMGCDIADYNNDGVNDLAVVEMKNRGYLRRRENVIPIPISFYRQCMKMGVLQYWRNTIYKGNENHTFGERGIALGLTDTEWSWSALWADFDNDGYLDLSTTNGVAKDVTHVDFVKSIYTGDFERFGEQPDQLTIEPPESPTQINFLFRGVKGESFEGVNHTWGLNQKIHTRGAAYADLDNDGDLDLVMNNYASKPFVYRNDLNKSNNYLRIEIIDSGRMSHDYAKVTIWHPEGVQYREQVYNRGWSSASQHVLHFGLGGADFIDSLSVKWLNGKDSVLRKISANQVIRIDKSEAISRSAATTQRDRLIEFGGMEIFSVEKKPWLSDYNFNRLLLRSYETSSCSYTLNSPIKIEEMNFDVSFADRKPGKIKVKWNNADRVIQVKTPSFSSLPCEIDLSEFVPSSAEKIRSARLFDITDCALQDSDRSFLLVARTARDYPYSQLWIRFQVDLTATCAYQITHIDSFRSGLNDLILADYDNDGTSDLLFTGDLRCLSQAIFKENREIELLELTNDLKGLYYSINAADFDSDGDVDFVLGGTGLNTGLRASAEYPMKLLSGDFDANGVRETLVFQFEDDDYYPIANRDEFLQQMPLFHNVFRDYSSYARAGLSDFKAEFVQAADRTDEISTLVSVVLENLGDGTFKFRDLPFGLQMSPIKSTIMQDFNADGYTDILTIPNFSKAYYGRGPIFDDNLSLFFGDGRFGFQSSVGQILTQSKISYADHLTFVFDSCESMPYIIALSDDGSVYRYRVNSKEAQFIPVKNENSTFVLTRKDGSKTIRVNERCLALDLQGCMSKCIIIDSTVVKIEQTDCNEGKEIWVRAL